MDRITVARALLPRISCPTAWPDIPTPLSRAQVIPQAKALFPEFDSLEFTHYCLNRYEELLLALAKPDRVRLIQLLTLTFYDSLFRLNQPKPQVYPRATNGSIIGGYIVHAPDRGLSWALVALELSLKDASGTKYSQQVVMERRKDLRLPDTWKFALIGKK